MALLQNFGLVKTAEGEAIVTQIPYPKLRDDYLIIQTIAVALNPTDWQNIDEPFKVNQKPTLTGCDAAGVVVEVGKNVTKNFKKGDRVAGIAHGGMFLVGQCYIIKYSSSQAISFSLRTVLLRISSPSKEM
jgi:NADPH:quinone reductase-like Zn-dependent oxidoreductase